MEGESKCRESCWGKRTWTGEGGGGRRKTSYAKTVQAETQNPFKPALVKEKLMVRMECATHNPRTG